MLTLAEIQKLLHDRRLTAVSEATKLSYDTVWRVANGKTIAVSYNTIKALSDYLQGK